MATEIERKFLLASVDWRKSVTRSERLVQGYLTRPGGGVRCSVRVRIGGDKAWLNIKAAVPGIERSEYEYIVPRDEADRMIHEFCDGVIEKVRHHLPHGGHTWEIDEFFGDNSGLVVAELELDSAGASFDRPSWLGKEVSDRKRYYNLHLLDHPYSRWSAAERAGD
jgi:adenylate cyclase